MLRLSYVDLHNDASSNTVNERASTKPSILKLDGYFDRQLLAEAVQKRVADFSSWEMEIKACAQRWLRWETCQTGHPKSVPEWEFS